MVLENVYYLKEKTFGVTIKRDLKKKKWYLWHFDLFIIYFKFMLKTTDENGPI